MKKKEEKRKKNKLPTAYHNPAEIKEGGKKNKPKLKVKNIYKIHWLVNGDKMKRKILSKTKKVVPY